MLKSLSAIVLAVSMLAVPVLVNGAYAQTATPAPAASTPAKTAQTTTTTAPKKDEKKDEKAKKDEKPKKN